MVAPLRIHFRLLSETFRLKALNAAPDPATILSLLSYCGWLKLITIPSPGSVQAGPSTRRDQARNIGRIVWLYSTVAVVVGQGDSHCLGLLPLVSGPLLEAVVLVLHCAQYAVVVHFVQCCMICAGLLYYSCTDGLVVSIPVSILYTYSI